jgi:hypothetical protein
MNTFLKFWAMLVLTGLVVACSKPHDTIIPSEVSAWDKELAPVMKELPEEDRDLFTAFVIRAKLTELFVNEGGIPFGMTVGQAIDAQKKWLAETAAKEAEEKALRERQAREAAELKAHLEAKRAESLEAIHNAVTVALVSKKELPVDFDIGRYSEYQQFSIGIKNNTNKTIAGVSGELEFLDLFEVVIGGVTFRITETIPPEESRIWTGGRDYNRFFDEHRDVWNLKPGQYTTRFIPESVIFTDGSRLNMPE